MMSIRRLLYTGDNVADINALHPWVKGKAIELKKLCKQNGIDITISQTLRSKEYQDSLYAQGRTKPGKVVTKCRYPQSLHCWGIAFDVAIVNKDGKTINWNTICDTDGDGIKDWDEIGKLGQSIGLEWGGSWDKFIDRPHFEAPNHDWKELTAKWGNPTKYIASWKK